MVGGFHWWGCLYIPEYLRSLNTWERKLKATELKFLESRSFCPAIFSLWLKKKKMHFFQRLALLRTWLKALLINMEYDLWTFTTGIFHVSIIFYSLAISIWLDPATGPWRENRQLKRPWVPSYAPVLLNSKQKYLKLVWHHQLKTGLDQHPPQQESAVFYSTWWLSSYVYDAAKNKGGCPLPQGGVEKFLIVVKRISQTLGFLWESPCGGHWFLLSSGYLMSWWD